MRPRAASTCGTIDCTPIEMRVTPAVPVGPQEVEGDVVGVALDRDLGAGADRERFEHREQRGGVDEAGCPAADEHRGDRREVRSRPLRVGAAGPQVPLGQVGAVGPGREVAVVAAAPAERDVQVDAGHGVDDRGRA